MQAWRECILLILLFGLIAFLLLAPLYSNTYIPNLDIWNHTASIAHAKLGLAEGQFPLRVAPTELNNWRYPQFQFYSPTSYTLAGLIDYLLPFHHPFITYKITLWLALMIGGLYFYRLANWLVQSKLAAILGATAYLSSPYYSMVVIHLMGGFNEAIALGLLPAVLFYSLKAYYSPPSKKIFLQISLVWYLLATIHFITFFYSSLMVAFLLLLLTIKNLRHKQNLIFIGMAYGFACLLAMWYLGPVLILGKYFAIATESNLYAPSLTDLFSPVITIANHHTIELSKQIQPNMGLPIFLAIVFSIYFLWFKPYLIKRFSRSSFLASYLLILFFIVFIMIWSPINFWFFLPLFLSVFQYSWRLLGQVIWIGGLLFAWVMLFFREELTTRITCLIILTMIASTSSWLATIKRPSFDIRYFFEHSSTLANPDSYVMDPKKYKHFIQPTSKTLLVNDAEKNCKQQGINTVCNIKAPSNIQLLELPLLYYPNMLSITLNGKMVPYQGVLYKNYPLVGITPLANQTNNIIAKFTGMAWANNVSRASWLIWSFILISQILHCTKNRFSKP